MKPKSFFHEPLLRWRAALLIVVSAGLLLGLVPGSLAIPPAQSPNLPAASPDSQAYTIPAHVVAAGGGQRSSANYTIWDTAGQPARFDPMQSSNYQLLAGYWRRMPLSLAPDAPTLYPISNPDGNGDYLVDWNDVTDATGYTLEEDDNELFSTPSVIYQGGTSEFGVTGRDVGTWYYRVLASNDDGDSPWSNVESAVVVDYAPTASIDDISPNPAIRGVDTVQFVGSGYDNDEGGASIVAYHWHSSLDGDLSSEASFSIPAADLSAGNHTISFQVMDDEDTWSAIVTEGLAVQDPSSPPTAYIDSISPNPATQGHDTITFVGHGVDSDESGASIVAYEWSSDLDGLLSDQASFSRAASDLAIGLHTIGFRVQDDEGEWSSQTTAPLTIEPEVEANWTVMLYFDGDNNLSIELNNALQRLEQSVAANPYINLLVLFDRDGTNNTYRYLVQPGGVYQDGVNRWYLGELNMGAQQTLIDFVTWALQNYPADHTYLSIVDHGRAAHGIAKDDFSGGDSLETQELRAALSAATNAGTNKIDVVQYDACSMGLLENAYQIQEYADYLVMSQNIVWGAFAYDLYLDGVTGATTTEDLALQIASAYHDHSGVSSKPHTISVLDLSQAGATKDAVDTLAAALRAAMVTPPVPTHVQNARNATQKFDSGNQNSWYRIDPYDEYVDLYHFADRAKAYVPDSGVDAAADAVMAAVSTDGTGLVVQQYHRSGYYTGPDGVQIYWDLDNAHGVSIFFPQASNSQDYTRYMSHLAFVFTGATQWDEFLSDYWGLLGLPPEPGDDGGYGETLPTGHRVFLPMVLKSQ